MISCLTVCIVSGVVVGVNVFDGTCFRPQSEQPSALQALRRRLDLRAILGKSRPVKHDSIISFKHLRREVFSEFEHAEVLAGIKVRTAMRGIYTGRERTRKRCFLFTARKRSLRRLYFHRCLSFHRKGGVCPIACWDTHTHTPGPEADTPQADTPQYMLGYDY